MRIKELKNALTPEKLCESPEAKLLLPFIENVFKLEFEDTPEYDKLRFLLVKGVLDLDSTPSKLFDWNQENQVSEGFNNVPIKIDPNESFKGHEFNIIEQEQVLAIEESEEILSNFEMSHSSGASNKAQILHNSLENSHNLESKMSMNGGYQFQHNTNQFAMQKGAIENLGASVIKMNKIADI